MDIILVHIFLGSNYLGRDFLDTLALCATLALLTVTSSPAMASGRRDGNRVSITGGKVRGAVVDGRQGFYPWLCDQGGGDKPVRCPL